MTFAFDGLPTREPTVGGFIPRVNGLFPGQIDNFQDTNGLGRDKARVVY
jgi:hypothetical protein